MTFFKCCCVLAEVRCAQLTAPANGDIDCSLGDDGEANPGETCTFTCDGGFQLSGSASRTCRSTRDWSGTTTSCTSQGIPILYQ